MGGRELARLCRLLPGRLALDLAQELPVPRLASLGARFEPKTWFQKGVDAAPGGGKEQGHLAA